jgi:hypothetical protein
MKWLERYDQALMESLIKLFRIDESQSYEKQPQWIPVLLLSLLFGSKTLILWTVLVLALGGWRWLTL